MGPFKEPDDVVDAMLRFADYLGDEHADEFVQSLIRLLDNGYYHLEVVYEFIDVYLQKYSTSIATTLLKYLTPQGPPLLVELLGTTRDERVVDLLVKTINFESAPEELLIAVIGAIGEIGGVSA
jgi:hypothetical protein